MNFINEFNESFYYVLSLLKQFLPFVICISVPIALIDEYISYLKKIKDEKQSKSDIRR